MTPWPDHWSTVVLGAGPAGLACAYDLARAGCAPLLVERSDHVGGLMRSLHRGAYVVDIGRKELYTRIQAVDALWSELLGDDYRPYEHREGILYQNRILETDRRWRGPLRGMSPWLAARSAAGLLRARLPWPGRRAPQNYEEWWHRQRGRTLSRALAQGFDEKFFGTAWADRPVPAASVATHPTQGQRHWRHPARGTGQICEALAREITACGGRIATAAELQRLEPDGSGSRIAAVQFRIDGRIQRLVADHVVSSLPIEVLGAALRPDPPPGPAGGSRSAPPGRATVLVYLFFAEPPRFPHAWLRVTCPALRAGRITNYAAFGGDMVPPGHTALCVEYFCRRDDPLLAEDEPALVQRALRECSAAGLAPARCDDAFALSLPLGDAATSWRDWLTPHRQRLMTAVAAFENLYDAQRPGTDKAMAAGLAAAQAIRTGDRRAFDTTARADRVGD